MGIYKNRDVSAKRCTAFLGKEACFLGEISHFLGKVVAIRRKRVFPTKQVSFKRNGVCPEEK